MVNIKDPLQSNNLLSSKILFNCTTNVVGGGLKNSAIFIRESLESKNIQWLYAISKEVRALLDDWGIAIDGRFKVFDNSPARNKIAAKELKKLVLDTNVKVVYTMAGPAYVKFPVFHVQGLSNGFLTHAGLSAFKLKGNIYQVLRYFTYVGYQFIFSLMADYYVFQTEEAKRSYCRRTLQSGKSAAVISNAIDEMLFNRLSEQKSQVLTPGKKITIFCPGAPYAHKAFQFLPAIAVELNKLVKLPYYFVLTLPESPILSHVEQNAQRLGVFKNFYNLGPYNYSQVIDLMAKADIVFVPSLLETFSASYLEAMAARKILIASDKKFAIDVCGEAASYVNPLDPKATAKVLLRAIEDPDSFQQQIEKGLEVLEKYGNHVQRYQKVEQLLLSIIQTL